MCPDKEILSAYYDNEVEEPWKSGIANHLLTCGSCREIIESFNMLSQFLHEDTQTNSTEVLERVKEKIITHTLSQGYKDTIWRKKLNIPFPAAVAAVLLFVFTSFFTVKNLMTPAAPKNKSVVTKPVVVDNNPANYNDLEALVKSMQTDEFNNEVIIQLPDESRFAISGEPQLIRVTNTQGR